MKTYEYREYYSGYRATIQAQCLEEAVDQVEASVRSCYSADTETIWIEGELQELGDSEVRPTVIVIHPDAPACVDEGDHDWQSPHHLLGGLPENPGVWGKGGGVIYTEVCMRCGTARTVDTWAQGPSGEQGLHSVKYDPYRYDVEPAI